MKVVKNLLNLSLSELLYELYYTNEEVYSCSIDYYHHIKKITEDFNYNLLVELESNLYHFFAYRVHLVFDETEIYNLNTVYFEQPKSDTVDYADALAFEIDNREGEFEKVNIGEKIGILPALDGLAIMLTEDNENVKLENKNGYMNLYPYLEAFINNSECKNNFNFMVLEEYDEEAGRTTFGRNTTTLYSNARMSRNRAELKFERLFKKENANQQKIERFKKWLQQEKYINEKNEHISGNATNFARIYYLCRENGIFNLNYSDSKGIKIFFSEFCVDVVEKIDIEKDSFQVVRKTVTNENATATDLLMDSNKTPYYETAKQRIKEIFNND